MLELYYNVLIVVECFKRLRNRKLYFVQFTLASCNCNDRVKIFCKSIIINPIPNSTADNTKKKNESETIFKLSEVKPILNAIT